MRSFKSSKNPSGYFMELTLRSSSKSLCRSSIKTTFGVYYKDKIRPSLKNPFYNYLWSIPKLESFRWSIIYSVIYLKKDFQRPFLWFSSGRTAKLCKVKLLITSTLGSTIVAVCFGNGLLVRLDVEKMSTIHLFHSTKQQITSYMETAVTSLPNW